MNATEHALREALRRTEATRDVITRRTLQHAPRAAAIRAALAARTTLEHYLATGSTT